MDPNSDIRTQTPMPDQNMATAPNQNSTQTSINSPRKKGNRLILGTVFIAVLILITGGIFLYSKVKNPSYNKQTSTIYQTPTSTASPTPQASAQSQDQQIDSNLNQLNSDQQGIDSSLNDQSVNLQ